MSARASTCPLPRDVGEAVSSGCHSLRQNPPGPRPELPFRQVLGVRVDGTNYPQATSLILQWAARAESRYVCEVPVNGIMEGWDHADFRAVLNEADLVTPGGMPIVWLLRRLGLRGQGRVYGPELMLRVCAAAAREGMPVGLYGGTRRTLARLQASLEQRYPGLNIVYAAAPPFRPLTTAEEASVAADVEAAGCRILFVGLGCPKQERWMARQRGRLPAVMFGVGAAFDFISGEKRQAYRWMQTAGLEWLFRWVHEPRRLFFRYGYHNPRFVWLAARQLWRARRHGGRELQPQPVAKPAPDRMDPAALERALRELRPQLILKRIADVCGAGVAMVLLSPLLLAIALLVKLSSRGPVLFRQTRVGWRGRNFDMLKFRSMRVETDPAMEAARQAAIAEGTLLKGAEDARVTGLGRVLRNTSLDELPQLFNVLKGDMSLIGPRPLIPFMLEGQPEFARLRALVRPGITGLWQVSDRENNTSARAMTPYDLEYIRYFSLRLDLRILWRTVFVVATGHGAC